MSSVLFYGLVGTQFLAIAVLLIEIVYISFLKPSRFQLEMVILLIATLIMLVGYSVELFATTPESAIAGAAMAYIGKPFALLMSLVFISDYCGHQIPRKIVLPLGIFSAIFPIIIFTNGTGSTAGHHLYYATVEFDLGQLFSPLVLTRGPLYIVYMIYLGVMFGSTLAIIIIDAIQSKSNRDKRPLIYLGGMILSTVAGYIIYMSGVTQGYDTTMTGAAIGALILTVLFFKFNIFDSLTYAKEHALQNVSTGLLVINDRNQPVYTNKKIDELTDRLFSVEELMKLPEGDHVSEKENQVFSISKSTVEKSGICYGQTIEIEDITAQHNYHTRLEHDVEMRTRQIRNIQRSVIASFAGIVEARDDSTGTHIKRMSRYVELIAKSLADRGKYKDTLTDNFISSLVDVAPLHDIGKLKIPDAVLLKPGRLNDEEIRIMRTHAAEGARIVRQCLGDVERPEYVELAAQVAGSHHEKWDGTGYPLGISGDFIPLAARIVAVADVYDAVRSERCYKPPMDKIEAKAIIVDGKGTHFDPEVVDAFLAILPKIESVKM